MKLNKFLIVSCIALLTAISPASRSLESCRTVADEVSNSKPDDTPAEEKSDSDKKITAIVGGDIHTVSQEVIRAGVILIEDGKIKAVGQGISVPDDAEIIDAKGMQITPGFVAIEMAGVGLGSTGGSNDKSADSLDPFDRNVTLALGVGITTGCVSTGGGGGRRFRAPEENFLGLEPDVEQLLSEVDGAELDYGVAESLCPCCGLPILPTDPITDPKPSDISTSGNVVIKMSFGSLDGMLVEEDVFYDVGRGSLTGALNRHTWREQIAKARKYISDQAEHEKAIRAGKKVSPPRKTVKDDLLKLVKGESRLRISAESASEIREMIELADELDYKLTLQGASEAWLVSELLAEKDVDVTITPRSRRRSRLGEEETSGSWAETPRVLQEAGVPFAVAALSSSISLNGLAGRDLTSLPLEAAFAVRGGSSEAEALRAITITPAKMMGLGDRIGTVEVGKDADLLILDGSPLDYRTYVQTAIVNGRVAYERANDRAYPVFEKQ